jgi:hypothetical protein
MSETEETSPSEAVAALNDYFAKVRLARATELAQSGHLDEAEAALVDENKLPSNATELDLLARIAARQGRFDEARHRWKSALQIEPGNETYRLCIESLTPAKRIVWQIANSWYANLNGIVWATIVLALATLVYVFLC